MSLPLPLDPRCARIVDRFHSGIASLIHGNHIDRSEVQKVGARSCLCQLQYDVQWHFVPHTKTSRVVGNGAVSNHFGYDRRRFEVEMGQRCEMGRTHQPIRQQFVAAVLGAGGLSLQRSAQSAQIWDFGQHSVHENCQPCHATGSVTCGACHGAGRHMCHTCGGVGYTLQTRWLTDHNGQSRSETYRQYCSLCGQSGRVICNRCRGSGGETCPDCRGHGLFTDICQVTVDAKPSITITVESALSQRALINFLLHYPLSQIAGQIEFKCSGNRDNGEDRWQVAYQGSGSVVELDLDVRGKRYMAAALGAHALPFVKPPIFDDIFTEELTDLEKIWSGDKRVFSSNRARKFFSHYSGQPVLDAAMKAVAKLKCKRQEPPEESVLAACDGYISRESAKMLGQCMSSLLDKVSPPNSIWSWIAVMAIPLLLIFLGAQNWTESNGGEGYTSLAIAWAYLCLIAIVLALLVSPVAAAISAVVSATRRRSVPAEYRQHGRNWQPLKRFIWAALGVASLGAGLGLVTRHDWMPRWDNKPMSTIEKTLKLNRTESYTQTMAWLSQAGFFVSPRATGIELLSDPVVWSIQDNLMLLGYNVAVTGQMDSATQQAMAVYAQKRKLKSIEAQFVLESLCKEVRRTCVKVTQTK